MTEQRRAYWIANKKKLQAYAIRWRAQRKKDLATGKVNPYRGEDPNWRRWSDMVRRCTVPKCKSYKNYGARGITVCKAWLESFDRFMDDMGKPPAPGLEIDRKDNDGNYTPSNCRWATEHTQSRNRRTIVMLTHNGRTQCLADWADELGLGRSTLKGRLAWGWTTAQALTTPAQRSGYTRKAWRA